VCGVGATDYGNLTSVSLETNRHESMQAVSPL